MEILSSLYNHPQLMVTIDFHSIDKMLLKSMATVNCLGTHTLRNIFSVHQKKETQTGLEQLEGG